MIFARFKKEALIYPDTIADIRVKASLRARRMALKVDARQGDVVLTLPHGTPLKKAHDFIAQNADWISRQRRSIVQPEKAYAGMTLSVAGVEYQVRHQPGRGVSRMEGNEIIIHGAAEHFSRRLKDFLKKEAENILTAAARIKLQKLNLSLKTVSIRDPKTRWGSCAPDGRLMFSWRLILAPPDVMDYVVAHEVAHRVHMNHGKKFWMLCASMTPNAAESRRWLRTQGTKLMAYL